MTTLNVSLGERSYPIYVAGGLLGELPELLARHEVGTERPLYLITDERVLRHYGNDVSKRLQKAGYRVGLSVVPPGEQSKSLTVLERLVTDALSFGLDRRGVVLALGGGMVGDLAGFFAASYMRGIPFVQLPTTLLAHDSSVGGKVAVNHPLAKNVIGAFHQPLAVVYDIETLQTLAPRELVSGFAEVIKHGLIADKTLLQLLEKNREQLLAVESPYIEEAILRGCQIKADVVSQDEREQNLRAILNYGHTVGHAVEALANFSELTHGEAIAIGMVAEAIIGLHLGVVGEAVVHKTRSLLSAYGLPTVLPEAMAEDDIVERMKHDKKNRSGKLVMVLPTAWGKVDIFKDIPETVVRKTLRQLKGDEYASR